MAEALRAERPPTEAPAAAIPDAAVDVTEPTAAPVPVEEPSPVRRFDQLYGQLLEARQKLGETPRAARARGVLEARSNIPQVNQLPWDSLSGRGDSMVIGEKWMMVE